MQNIINQILLQNAAAEAEGAAAQEKQQDEIQKFNKMLDAFKLELEANQY